GGPPGPWRDGAGPGMLFTPGWGRVSPEPIVSSNPLRRIRELGRPALFENGGTGRGIIERLRGERPRHNSWQWDFVAEDGDFYKGGYGGQGLYISPIRHLVVAFTGTPPPDGQANDLMWISRQLAVRGPW